MKCKKNTKVKCLKCGKEKEVDFTYCLGNGWPKCCGYTMMMINTKANIGNSVKKVIEYNTKAKVEISKFNINGKEVIICMEKKLFEV